MVDELSHADPRWLARATAAEIDATFASLKDPYGNPFYYRYPGKVWPSGFDLWSAGPDGLHGAKKSHDPNDALDGAPADDIGNWQFSWGKVPTTAARVTEETTVPGDSR